RPPDVRALPSFPTRRSSDLHGSALTLKPDAGTPQPLGQVFLMGVGVNLLNPKIVMFFLTFLPQFVSANDPHAGGKLMFLGLYFIDRKSTRLNSSHSQISYAV